VLSTPAGIGFMAGVRCCSQVVDSGAWGLEAGGRAGLVTGHSDPQRPSTGSIWRPILRVHVQLGEGGGGGPLDRAVGVNPGLSLQDGMRLVVLVPQHQTAMYETYNNKKLWLFICKVRDQLNAL
jgi:hypothetical protein